MEKMTRLSIELPKHQHQKIKALAAWHGLSLKDYILERTIDTEPKAAGDDPDMKAFMDFLAPRIKEAQGGKVSALSMDSIIKKAKNRRRH